MKAIYAAAAAAALLLAACGDDSDNARPAWLTDAMYQAGVDEVLAETPAWYMAGVDEVLAETPSLDRSEAECLIDVTLGYIDDESIWELAMADEWEPEPAVAVELFSEIGDRCPSALQKLLEADEDVDELDEPAEAETTTTTAAGLGSRDDPIPAGESARIGDWEVTLAPTNRDATDAVMAENEFNDPPAAGRVFVMVEVMATYVGDESGTPWLDLTFDFVDAAGNTRGTALEDYCGVIPNSLDDVGEMFAGASGTGNVCVVVSADQVDGGTWIVEDFVSFEQSRVFFALDGE